MLDHAETDRPMVGQIAALIRALILDGRLPQGTDMPRSREIAASLGVGLATVQDGITLLKGEGLVVGGKGRTYRVRVKPPVRHLSANRYVRELETLHRGLEPESAFCADYGIGWEDYSAEVQISNRAAGDVVAHHTGWRPGDLVLRRRMVEYADGIAVQVRTSIIAGWLASQVPELGDPARHPVRGGVLAELHAAGVSPHAWREWFPVRQPTRTEATALDIDPDVWVYQWMRTFSYDGEVIEISETIIPCHALIFQQEGELP